MKTKTVPACHATRNKRGLLVYRHFLAVTGGPVYTCRSVLDPCDSSASDDPLNNPRSRLATSRPIRSLERELCTQVASLFFAQAPTGNSNTLCVKPQAGLWQQIQEGTSALLSVEANGNELIVDCTTSQLSSYRATSLKRRTTPQPQSMICWRRRPQAVMMSCFSCASTGLLHNSVTWLRRAKPYSTVTHHLKGTRQTLLSAGCTPSHFNVELHWLQTQDATRARRLPIRSR